MIWRIYCSVKKESSQLISEEKVGTKPGVIYRGREYQVCHVFSPSTQSYNVRPSA